MNRGEIVRGNSEAHMVMHRLSSEAIRICMELNNSFHTREEILALMSELTGKPVDPTFTLFPSFNSDCGKNINPWKARFHQLRL